MSTHSYPKKTCMACGEVIDWLADCSYGHFAQIGRELRNKAVRNTRRRE